MQDNKSEFQKAITAGNWLAAMRVTKGQAHFEDLSEYLKQKKLNYKLASNSEPDQIAILLNKKIGGLGDWFLIGFYSSILSQVNFSEESIKIDCRLKYRRLMENVAIPVKARDEIQNLTECIFEGKDNREVNFTRLREMLFEQVENVTRQEQENSKEEKNNSEGITKKLVVLVVLLSFGLFGFFLFQNNFFISFLWLAFFITAIPPAMVFVLNPHSWGEKSMIKIYRIGIKSIPLIGRIFE